MLTHEATPDRVAQATLLVSGGAAYLFAGERRLAPDIERAAPVRDGRSARAAESGHAHEQLAGGREAWRHDVMQYLESLRKVSYAAGR